MKKVIIIGILILGVFLAVLSQIPLGLEPLTEVYFENHTELPKHLFLNKFYNFSFTAHNLEEQDMNYEYVIECYNEDGDLIYELDRKSFFLLNEESKTFEKKFMFTDNFDKAKINIRIIKKPVEEEPWFEKKLWWQDPNYPYEINIHFWAEEIVGTTVTIIPD